jgi:hypothetical protein
MGLRSSSTGHPRGTPALRSTGGHANVTVATMMKMTLTAVGVGLSLRRGVAFSNASAGHQTRDVGESTPSA